MNTINYKSGYKYQLTEQYVHRLSFKIPHVSRVYIYREGSEGTKLGDTLIIKRGYAWDGPSGPTFDSKTFMRGSLIHDALYQLIRNGVLPITYRDLVDHELYLTCLADGMMPMRAWWVWKAVKFFAASAASAKNKKEVESAP